MTFSSLNICSPFVFCFRKFHYCVLHYSMFHKKSKMHDVTILNYDMMTQKMNHDVITATESLVIYNICYIFILRELQTTHLKLCWCMQCSGYCYNMAICDKHPLLLVTVYQILIYKNVS